MTYTSAKPPLPETAEELRARIPGWGVDLDPADRPSVPREALDPEANGAHWEFPERQLDDGRRERSIEHAMLTPVFGTSCPTRGLSGVVRRLAYRRYSEARAAHWLLLIGADRIDATEAHLRSFATLRPDQPFTQTGLRSEVSGHGWSSRVRRRRADLAHLWLDPIIVGGPWLAAAAAIVLGVRRVVGIRRRS
ncbi:MAG: hypothetical protein JWO77_2203 [Ilumatobacteraceae bacterium]|nr:hypothetical protein [Ilumatobacteraceae bacterium]